ncbi:hypothetical protein E2C01_045894 [Portunus trituberculatus]|uniref:Uncharacterized protein n=1 Tax=Portunus trituberculatus TaxID=210409 RepID=A0A5B7G671_PORTR|nr:hypothetical protein [Portunus trituberculatus]
MIISQGVRTPPTSPDHAHLNSLPHSIPTPSRSVLLPASSCRLVLQLPLLSLTPHLSSHGHIPRRPSKPRAAAPPTPGPPKSPPQGRIPPMMWLARMFARALVFRFRRSLVSGCLYWLMVEVEVEKWRC